MNKKSLLFFVAMIVYTVGYAEDISKSSRINMHRIQNRALIYINCVLQKATPEERKAAVESFKKDGPIILGSGVVMICGGVIVAMYGKDFLHTIRATTKLTHFQESSLSDSDKENALSVVNNVCDSTESDPTRICMIEGKQVTIKLGKEHNVLQLIIDADLQKRNAIELYPYMQTLAEYIAQEKNARIDVIINADTLSMKNHFDGQKWSIKNKKIKR